MSLPLIGGCPRLSCGDTAPRRAGPEKSIRFRVFLRALAGKAVSLYSRREEAVQGKGCGRRPAPTPHSQLRSVRRHAGRRPWAERSKNRPQANAFGGPFKVTPLRSTSPPPSMAGLFPLPAMNRLLTPVDRDRARRPERGSSPNATPLP